MLINSDLAVEFAREYAMECSDFSDSAVQKVVVDDKKVFGARCGVYYDIDCTKANNIAATLTKCLQSYDVSKQKVLFVGLGNPRYICDALGEIVLDKLPPPSEVIAKFKPQVSKVTGINSYDLILAAKKIIKPSVVIAIDSLATSNMQKIGASIQITNVGFTPGSGVGNGRKVLDTRNLGVPILAVGVPLVASLQGAEGIKYVVPIDIEDVVTNLSNILAAGITQYLK